MRGRAKDEPRLASSLPKAETGGRAVPGASAAAEMPVPGFART